MLLLPATLTSREARVTLRMLQQALQSEGSETPVVVEAGSLQQLDSAALASVLRWLMAALVLAGMVWLAVGALRRRGMKEEVEGGGSRVEGRGSEVEGRGSS
jgi:hypothetical protein